MSDRRERAYSLMKAGQSKLINAFEAQGEGTFEAYSWERPGGGGGTARVLERGSVFERAGVNVSAVQGEAVPPSLAKQHPGTEGKPFFATGISMVLHPVNPYVPSFHANYRYFEVGDSDIWWFGGGADLTPYYPFKEDVIHFHQSLKAQCDRHPQANYQKLKEICDDYFYIKHRNEMRGIGGIFFDELSKPGTGDWEADFNFAKDGIDTILEAYIPVIEKHKNKVYGEREQTWQRYRRGRYVEFNLVYDRGTLFGLQTGGNIEAILMSMPLYAHWTFNYQPEAGSPEAEMLEYLQPRDWV
ncbi:MAG: oxygen-dependent coproporphyrinogen oxidase [Trueperaceae bacterium]|nr:oxygen-dependent coproporphyrinogen oxidase [Trueperaceae bacterium]